MHQDALGRRAHLSRQMECRRHRRGRGDVGIGAVHHDQRIAATRLDHARLQPLAASSSHLLTRFDAAGEGDHLHALVGDQRLRRLGAAGQARHQPRRQAGEMLHELERAQRGRRRRLDHHRVADGQRGRDRERHQDDREVVRHDVRGDAEREILGILQRAGRRRAGQEPAIVARHLRVVAEDRSDIQQLAHRLGVGLAHLARHQLGDRALRVRFHRVGDAMQRGGAALGIQRRPGALRDLRSLQRRPDMPRVEQGDLPHHAQIGGVDHVLGLRAGNRAIAAGDEDLRGEGIEAHRIM